MSPQAGHVALVGLSGTGKSTVAPVLAARWGLEVIDVDAAVVARVGRSVADVFATDGEEAFRALESAELAEALAGPPAVIATGGGIVLNGGNRELLAARAAVVWLRAEVDRLLKRLEADDEARPLLDGGREVAAQRLIQMVHERGPLYAAVADAVVDVGGLSVSDVADAVDLALSEAGA